MRFLNRLPRQRLNDMLDDHVAHVEIFLLLPQLRHHRQMSQRSHSIAYCVPLPAVDGVVGAHAEAVAQRIFEGGVRGGVLIGEREVLRDERLQLRLERDAVREGRAGLWALAGVEVLENREERGGCLGLCERGNVVERVGRGFVLAQVRITK